MVARSRIFANGITMLPNHYCRSGLEENDDHQQPRAEEGNL